MPGAVEDFPQRGRILVHGQLATKFWVRVLDLESEIAQGVGIFATRPRGQGAWGIVPCVAEYQVDDNFYFIYFLIVEIDMIGISGGNGMIYFASANHREEIVKVRNQVAKDLLEKHTHKFDEVIELEPKKEQL